MSETLGRTSVFPFYFNFPQRNKIITLLRLLPLTELCHKEKRQFSRKNENKIFHIKAGIICLVLLSCLFTLLIPEKEKDQHKSINMQILLVCGKLRMYNDVESE